MSNEHDSLMPNVRFVELVDALTQAGRVEWLRSELDVGFVYCLIDTEDLIVFECMGGKKGDEYVDPSEELAGIVAHHSNTTYLWLPLLPSWDVLLKPLRSTRIDSDRWRACRRIAHAAPIRALERTLEQ